MRVRVPDYFDGFFCLAGTCPHSCCIGWEVVLDEDTVRRYQQLPGSLGERLRDAMTLDGEDVCFPLDGHRCPFLNQENLCDIHCALGPEATSVTCREHPRFIEDYGPFQEITLSAACPKANELLLGSRDPLTFSERQDNQPTEDGDEWLDWLVPLRDRLLDLLRDRSRPLKARLRDFLLVAGEAQQLLDSENMAELAAFCTESWAISTETDAGSDSWEAAACRCLQDLEILEPDWLALLKQWEQAPELPSFAPQDPEKLERIAVYFAFRYLLKAVNDGDLLGRAQFCALGVLVTDRLSRFVGLPEALRLFSRLSITRRIWVRCWNSSGRRRAFPCPLCWRPSADRSTFVRPACPPQIFL